MKFVKALAFSALFALAPSFSSAADVGGQLNVPQVARDAAEFEQAVEAIVKRVINENPVLVFEALQRFMAEEEQAVLEEMRDKDRASGIPDSLPSFGPLGTGPAVLLFYDYSCAACVDAALEVAKLAYETGSIRLYLMDIATNEDALEASRIAAAAREQGQERFETMHLALLDAVGSGHWDIAELAERAGVNEVQLRADLRDLSPAATVNAARDQANKHEVERLPAVVIGSTKLEGTISSEKLLSVLHDEAAREIK